MESKIGTLLRFVSPALLLLVGLYTKEFTLNCLEFTREKRTAYMVRLQFFMVIVPFSILFV